jgi:ATP-dependent DNA ligase
MSILATAARQCPTPIRPPRRTPVRRSGYFAVGGWTGQTGMLGSVLVGAYDRAGNFVYCGRIMSGFTNRARRDLSIRLSEISCDIPFPAATRRQARRALGDAAAGRPRRISRVHKPAATRRVEGTRSG